MKSKLFLQAINNINEYLAKGYYIKYNGKEFDLINKKHIVKFTFYKVFFDYLLENNQIKKDGFIYIKN